MVAVRDVEIQKGSSSRSVFDFFLEYPDVLPFVGRHTFASRGFVLFVISIYRW